MGVSVRRATLEDLDQIAPLFAEYRVFYAQAHDLPAAREFLRERMQRDESIVLMAIADDRTVGFTQLYPFFSSVRVARTWILNDLYVARSARRSGVARGLLQTATNFAREAGALRLELETSPENKNAQALYRALGWQQHDDTLRFRLPLLDGVG